MSRGPHNAPQKWGKRRKLTVADTELIDRSPAFAALAQRHGYSPSEFLIIRRMEMLDEEARIEEEIDSGAAMALGATTRKNKREYQGTSNHNAEKRLAELQREGMLIDIQLMPYEKPKLRSMEVNMNVEQKTVVDYLKEVNERRATKAK